MESVMVKSCARSAVVLGAMVLLAVPAAAQQSLNVSLGYFAPKGEDARVRGDVLRANREFLAFDLPDFGGATIGAEWLVPVGRFVEGGFGVSFSRRTVPSVYAGFIDSDGSEIEQDSRLRRVPVDVTARVLPFGRDAPVQPYIGIGATVLPWRYSEFGEFVDFDAGRRIFRGDFVASGTAAGAVVLGGIRFSGESGSAGFEVRFHKADAALDSRFAGSRLDLGGWSYQFTAGLRF
jgi:hypothetical protein